MAIYLLLSYFKLIMLLEYILSIISNVINDVCSYGQVILSVAKERSLQNMTNMFIVSLAVADLCVAGVVMPFYTYTMVGFTMIDFHHGRFRKNSLHCIFRLTQCLYRKLLHYLMKIIID